MSKKIYTCDELKEKVELLEKRLAECKQKADEAVQAFHDAASYRRQEPKYIVVETLLRSISTIATLALVEEEKE